MVKLSESKGKVGEGFARIMENDELGTLFSKVQSTMIRAGHELEKILKESVDAQIITTLADLKEGNEDSQKPPLQIVFKPSRPDPDGVKKSIQADILIVDNENQLFRLVEIKEGHVFDTKKSDGELASLKSITSWLAQEFPYKADYYLCSFNQEDPDEIVKGTKKRFTQEHVLTGRELCEIIGIDYDRLQEIRKQDQNENRKFFLSKLLEIPEIRDEILNLINDIV